MTSYVNNERGLTLIELTILIVVVAILAGLAMQSATMAIEDVRKAQAEIRLENLAHAIVGNPILTAHGIRSDFGYVGDIGALPTSLRDLAINPGGLPTWNGPYVDIDLNEDTLSYRTDPWGVAISFDGSRLTSTGNGTAISQVVLTATNHYLYNNVIGLVTDNADSLPGASFVDSVRLEIDFPRGSSGLITRSLSPELDGVFSFDSIPVGIRTVRAIWLPDADTLTRAIAVLPNYQNRPPLTFRFTEVYFSDTSGSGGGGGGSGNPDTLINASFTGSNDGFVYADDLFRSTSQPSYADGSYDGSYGQSGGGLRVTLGGINGNDIDSMSGGFEHTVTVTEAGDVSLQLAYRLDLESAYESGECSHVLVSWNGTLYGESPNDYVGSELCGGGDSNWQTVVISLGYATPGSYTLALGGFNNAKTASNEWTEISFDDVLLVVTP